MRLLAGRLELLCHRLSRELMIATFAAALLANAIAITNVFPYAPLATEWQGMATIAANSAFTPVSSWPRTKYRRC